MDKSSNDLTELSQHIAIKEARQCYLEISEQESPKIAVEIGSEAAALVDEILLVHEKEVASYKAKIQKIEAELILLKKELDSDIHIKSAQDSMEDAKYNMKLVAFLNAKHYMVYAGKKGAAHGHSWQFQVEAAVTLHENKFIKFEDLDRYINQMLAPYQRTVLNEIPPFTEIEPLTENIAVVFYNLLEEEFAKLSIILIKLIVWENPTKGIEINRKMPRYFTINEPVQASDLVAKAQNEAAAGSDEEEIQIAHELESLEILNPDEGKGKIAESGIVSSDTEEKRAVTGCVKELEPSFEDTNSNAADNKEIRISQVDLTESNKQETLDATDENAVSSDSLDKQSSEEPDRHYPIWQYILAMLAIAGVAIFVYWPILSASPDKIYPVGLDTWGHLYKAEFLYQQILNGNFYPRFTADWYNGSQLFRYWAPLPYYLIALLRFCSTNIFVAGNIYMFVCALLGGGLCLFWTKQINLNLATLLGITWVMWPNNLKIALAEGNYPRTLTTALLPLIFFLFYLIIKGKRSKSLFIITIILIHILVLCHAMMAAIYCICFMLFAIILWILGGCSFKDTLHGFLVLVLGIISSSWWLIPSLKGGIAGMGKVAAAGAVEFIPLTISFNPFNRFSDPGSLYFGMILLIVIILYFLMRPSKPIWAKSLFWVGFFCIIITLPQFAPIHQLLPLSEILWPLRFTTFACFAVLLCGLAFSNEYLKSPSQLRRIGVILLLTALFAINFVDSYFSIQKLVRTQSQPSDITRISQEIKESPGWRVAAIDLSSLSSIPSYMFSILANREQVFGWAWQGATTAQNIMLLNTALEHNSYPFLFRQAAQLGATDLVVKDSMVKIPQNFAKTANLMGFNKVMKLGGISYWHSLQKPYLQLNKEECLAIGSHASIYALQFPMIEIGQSTLIDDYTLEDLKQYKLIILSGADWHYRNRAEKLILDYARSGGRVIVDLTGFPTDVLSKQAKFLDVYAETVQIHDQLSVQTPTGIYKLKPFSNEFTTWKTNAPQPLDEIIMSYNYYGNTAPVFGYKMIDETQIWFVGANPAYHAFLTDDPVALELLKQILQLRADYVPAEKVALLNYKIQTNGYSMTYFLKNNEKATLPISFLEGMQAKLDGDPIKINRYENLISLQLPAGQHTIELELINPPIYLWGGYISVVSVFLILIFLYWEKISSIKLIHNMKFKSKELGRGV